MEHCKIVSLDIWDTVLRRRCHPDEIKLATARFLYLAHYRRLKPGYQDVQRLLEARIGAEREIAGQHQPEYDDEYSIRDVFGTMLRQVLAAPEGVGEIVEALYAFERDKEAAMAYLDPEIVRTIEQYDYEKMGYISDFYAGEDFIDDLLERAGFPLPISFKYVSCDHRLNKRSGRLYQKALAELGVASAEQVHIGDNKYSDVEVPNRMGIRAVHYAPAKEHAKRKAREALFSVEAGHDMGRILGQLYDGTGLETELAPFFTAFALWMLEDCVKRGIRKIYYFTREGEFFIELQRRIERSGLFPAGLLPEAEVLEVSRISTFAASLRSVTLQEMMRLWNQYSVQSMGAFGKSVSMEEGALDPWLARYGLTPDEVITYPWLDERVQRLFQDGAFIAFFQGHIDSLRELAKAYFRDKGLTDQDPETVAIVDIGWRGSIQDNICCLYPDHRFVGYYLALAGFLNEQPANSEKYGYLNGLPNYEYLLGIVAPIEMLCNSPNGSTTGYARQPDGSVRAIRKKEPAEDSIYERYTGGVQRAILDRVGQVCRALDIHSICAGQLREQTYQRFTELLLYPHRHRELANMFFQLKHNEEFGVGGFVDKHVRLRLDLMVRGALSQTGRQVLLEYLNSTSWPQGYLVKYHLDPLVKIFNWRLGMR